MDTPTPGARALVGEAVSAIARVVDSEVRLAAIEAQQSARDVRRSAALIVGGGLILLIAGHALAWAAVLGMAEVGIHPAIGALLTAGFVGALGTALLASGRSAWPTRMWTPARLWQSLHADIQDITTTPGKG